MQKNFLSILITTNFWTETLNALARQQVELNEHATLFLCPFISFIMSCLEIQIPLDLDPCVI